MKHGWKMTSLWAVGGMVSMTMAACSVHSSGGGSSSLGPIDKFEGKPRVQGPAVQGVWSSGCVADGYESKSLTLTFNGGSFVRDEESFSDQSCQTNSQKQVNQGDFIFSVAYPDGGYEIDYAEDIGNGVTMLTDEKLLLDKTGKLYISHYVIGEDAPVDTSMPLTKQGAAPAPGASPTPAPTPAPSSGQCQNYQGRYQMNDAYFEWDQNACQTLTWTDLTVDNATPVVYQTDGVARDYSGVTMKIYFSAKGHLKREYQNQGHSFLETWSFQTQPCDLANPDGENYLTRDVIEDGQSNPDLCAFYSRIQ